MLDEDFRERCAHVRILSPQLRAFTRRDQVSVPTRDLGMSFVLVRLIQPQQNWQI